MSNWLDMNYLALEIFACWILFICISIHLFKKYVRATDDVIAFWHKKAYEYIDYCDELKREIKELKGGQDA